MVSPPPGLYTSEMRALDPDLITTKPGQTDGHRVCLFILKPQKLESQASPWLGFSKTGSYESESARGEDNLPEKSRSLEHDFTPESPAS